MQYSRESWKKLNETLVFRPPVSTFSGPRGRPRLRPLQMHVPHLPDELQCRIAHFLLLSTIPEQCCSVDVMQYETTSGCKRHVARGPALVLGSRVHIVQEHLEVDPVPELRYNFTLMKRRDGGLGVYESNSGESYFADPPRTEPFVGLLPWGEPSFVTMRPVAWSRATRQVVVRVPTWSVPRSWGFRSEKTNISKVVVIDNEGYEESRLLTDTLGVVHDSEMEEFSAKIERMDAIPDEVLRTRLV